MKLEGIYKKMLAHFGPREWWPVSNGFAPPEWEVCVGAILTQNTNWRNVERVLDNLKNEKMISPTDIKNIDKASLERLVRPSGYYRQKAERLKTFADFGLSFGAFPGFSKNVTRERLLGVKGLGPETADSILLYALGRPVFVIDAYTKRVFRRLGIIDSDDYEKLRKFFEESVPKDAEIYKEFHALIVEHAKNYCRKRPLCSGCVLRDGCGHQPSIKV